MSAKDVSVLDGKCVMAMLMGAVRAERFCDGALLGFFKKGCIKKWLERLKKIDESGGVRVCKGSEYLFVMRGTLSLLSAQRPWAEVVKHLDEIDDIFFGYDAERILEQTDTYFVDRIREIKCGNKM